MTVRVGETFSVECAADGFPVPLINWRLNWAHVCAEPRCHSHTDRHGHGRLTVERAEYGDQGAYSCEAINSQGRVFATPDTIVTVLAPVRPTTTTIVPGWLHARLIMQQNTHFNLSTRKTVTI